MNLIIDLNEYEVARVQVAARIAGVPAAELLKRLALEHLPSSSDTDLDTKLLELQRQDGISLSPDSPANTLFEAWASEDAEMSDTERQAEEQLWTTIENDLVNDRGIQLRGLGR
jgi:hypothetical protein